MRITPLILALYTPLVTFAAPPAKIDFETHVRPLLEQKCFSCHGDEVQRPAAAGAARHRHADPPSSTVRIRHPWIEKKLIKRVLNGDGGMKMPPSGPLSNDEIDLLKAWIDQGADFRMELRPEAPAKSAPDQGQPYRRAQAVRWTAGLHPAE